MSIGSRLPSPPTAGALPGKDPPRLVGRRGARRLVVAGKPFLILGGELGNSSASSLRYLDALWPKLVELNLNTVLAPVYWELFEPEEEKFDPSLVEGLVAAARSRGLKLVLLWFGSWKNSMSCYAPLWVKADPSRFPRARLADGRSLELLSAFETRNLEADARAFSALMRCVRDADPDRDTVILVQVENEIGMLENARDHGPAANAAFDAEVPSPLLHRIVRQIDAVAPELRDRWQRRGSRTQGRWEEVFGPGLATDEIFMAWHYARYVDEVAARGKAEYPLPMFVNAALNRAGHEPGRYPSAGPLPHLMDVWQVGAPHIDFFSPDIYYGNFEQWCAKYARSENELFIPEAVRGPESAIHAFYAVGRHGAIGFSPFAVELIEGGRNAPLARAYDVLRQIAPLLLERPQETDFDWQAQSSSEQQAQNSLACGEQRDVTAVVLDKQCPTASVVLGNTRLQIAHDWTWEWSSGDRSADIWPRVGGILISLGSDEYLVAGCGIIITFAPLAPDDPIPGIANADEGTYENGRWTAGRRLNGDETHQGRHVRIPPGEFGIQRIRLYRYR